MISTPRRLIALAAVAGILFVVGLVTYRWGLAHTGWFAYVPAFNGGVPASAVYLWTAAMRTGLGLMLLGGVGVLVVAGLALVRARRLRPQS